MDRDRISIRANRLAQGINVEFGHESELGLIISGLVWGPDQSLGKLKDLIDMGII